MRSQEEIAEMRTRANEVGEQFASDPAVVELARKGATTEIQKRAVEAGLPPETQVTTTSNQFCFRVWGIQLCFRF